MLNKKAISPYIRTAMHSTLPAGYVIGTRMIFDYELIFVEDGRCRITIDGTCHICKKNDVIFLRPDVPHRFECFDDQDFVQPHIHFDPIYSALSEKRWISFKNRSEMSYFERSLIQTDLFADVPIPDVFTPYDSERFRTLFFEIIALYETKPPNYELLYKSRLTELIALLLSQFEPEQRSIPGNEYSVTATVKDFIDNNYLQPITLDSLSKQFHINKFTLLRSFSNRYQKSVIAYYRELRMEYAKHLLRTTDCSVTSIGEQLGFSDVYSFSRTFRVFAGISPKAFRENELISLEENI